MSYSSKYIISHLALTFIIIISMMLAIILVIITNVILQSTIALSASSFIFSEILYTFPQIFNDLLPISISTSLLLSFNRLTNHQELVSMVSLGKSNWQLLSPFLIFSTVITLLTLSFNTWLLPQINNHSLQAQEKNKLDITALSSSKNIFIQLPKGKTLYIQDTLPSGGYKNVLLHDTYEKNKSMTYYASEAFFIQNNQETRFLLINGNAVQKDNKKPPIKISFSEYNYDLSSFFQNRTISKPHKTQYLYKLPSLYNSEEIPLKARHKYKVFFHKVVSNALNYLALCSIVCFVFLRIRTRGNKTIWLNIISIVTSGIYYIIYLYIYKLAKKNILDINLMYIPPICTFILFIFFTLYHPKYRIQNIYQKFLVKEPRKEI